MHTGGNDLKELIDIPDAIVEVDINDPGSIRNGFKKVTKLSDDLTGADLLGDKGRRNLSWRAYAERYSQTLPTAWKQCRDENSSAKIAGFAIFHGDNITFMKACGADEHEQ